jgi:hypothetical protein
MKKKFGRNKAGGITKKNSVIMIVSIIAVTLFIGIAIQPVIAAPLYSDEAKEVEEECIPCKYEEEYTLGDAKCKTCVGAVFHSVRYMKDHVRTVLKGRGVYFLWTVDASILIFEGIILGLQDSGFKFEIDYVDLFQYINNSVNKLVDPANYLFPVTKYLAILFAIPIGITVYLLRLCNGD